MRRKVNPICNIKAATVVTLDIRQCYYGTVHHTTLIQITYRNQAIVFVICYLIDMQSFLKLSSAAVVDIERVSLITRPEEGKGKRKAKA